MAALLFPVWTFHRWGERFLSSGSNALNGLRFFFPHRLPPAFLLFPTLLPNWPCRLLRLTGPAPSLSRTGA